MGEDNLHKNRQFAFPGNHSTRLIAKSLSVELLNIMRAGVTFVFFKTQGQQRRGEVIDPAKIEVQKVYEYGGKSSSH